MGTNPWILKKILGEFLELFIFIKIPVYVLQCFKIDCLLKNPVKFNKNDV